MKLSDKVIDRFTLLRDRFHAKPEPNQLLVEMQSVKAQLDQARSSFELQTNLDLIESNIYEIESLEVRYNYLIKQARAAGLRHSDFLEEQLLSFTC